MTRKTWVDQVRGKQGSVPTVKSDAPPGSLKRIMELEDQTKELEEQLGTAMAWIADLERDKDGLGERISALEELWSGEEGAVEVIAGEPEVRGGGEDPFGTESGETGGEGEGEGSEVEDPEAADPGVDGTT